MRADNGIFIPQQIAEGGGASVTDVLPPPTPVDSIPPAGKRVPEHQTPEWKARVQQECATRLSRELHGALDDAKVTIATLEIGGMKDR